MLKLTKGAIKLNKSKVFIGFSAIISLLMCALTSSYSFLFSHYIMHEGTIPDMINEIVNEVFNYKYITSLNVMIAVVFLLNSISLILYLFKTDKRAKMVKYFSLWSTLLLIIGLVLFVFHVSAIIEYYEIINDFEQFSFKFKILRWIPRLILFSIPTIYLLGIQFYVMNDVKSVKLNIKSIILSIYFAFMIFLAAITFVEFSLSTDLLAEKLRLKTAAIKIGDQIMGTTHANIDYYLYYVMLLTVVFGAIMLFSRKKSKKQIK